MDIKAAFRNSPIWPPHKVFCVVAWDGAFYVDHVFPFGLATAPGIQGCVADATVDILAFWEIAPVFKWVDDFSFLREPCNTVMHEDGSMTHSYAYSLVDIIRLTGWLGIPWHPVEKKGHDFTFSAVYVRFNWDLECHAVSLPERKR